MGYRNQWNQFPAYVSVSERQEKAKKMIEKLRKKKMFIQPISISDRNIAKTVWGKAWCKHIESYSDFENRLPKGRSYVRSGAVIDLQIHPGKIIAQVMGSSLYNVSISIEKLEFEKWKVITHQCAGKIDSVIELLQGKISKGIMEIIVDRERGLFPDSNEIKFQCSCLDWAAMCKHVAAALYGIGARLDQEPETLFQLRQVNHIDLTTQVNVDSLMPENINLKDDLSALFDIEIAGD